MTAKQCLKKSARILGIGIKKATSYQMVKGRLNYRWYNDEYLQARINTSREEVSALVNNER